MDKEERKNQLEKKLKRNNWLRKYRNYIYIGIASALMVAAVPGMALGSIALTWSFFGPALATLIGGGLDLFIIGDERFHKKKQELQRELQGIGYNIKEQINDKGQMVMVVEKRVETAKVKNMKKRVAVRKSKYEAVEETVKTPVTAKKRVAVKKTNKVEPETEIKSVKKHVAVNKSTTQTVEKDDVKPTQVDKMKKRVAVKKANSQALEDAIIK